MQDDANPYQSPVTVGTQSSHKEKPFLNRATLWSCYATLAELLLFGGSFASFSIWHPRRGTHDPVPVFAELSSFAFYMFTMSGFLANLVAHVSGITGMILGLRRGTVRSVLFATVAVLLNGGWLAAFIVYCYCTRRHSV